MAAVTLLQCLYHMLLAGEAGRIPIAEGFWEKKKNTGYCIFLERSLLSAGFKRYDYIYWLKLEKL